MTIWGVTGAVTRKLWLLAALLIIGCAIVVATVRELLPVVDRFQPQIDAWLSARAGLAISTGQLGGEWSGLSPQMTVTDLVIAAPAGEEAAITIGRAVAELNLLKSLLGLTLAWERFEISDLRVAVTEDGNGQWSIAGHPLAGGDGDGLARLRELIYYTGFLRLDRAVFEAHFYSGTQVNIYAPEVQIDNSGDFHRTVARLAMADNEDVAQLILEGRGNLGSADFVGKGYIQFKRINFDASLSAIAKRWFPQQVARVGEIDTEVDLSLWFDWREGGRMTGRGTLRAAELPLNWVADAGSLEQVEADVTAWYQPGRYWGLRLQNLGAQWAGEVVHPFTVQFRQRVGRRWGELNLAVDRVDLGLAQDLLARSALLGDTFADVLADLNPRGLLQRVEMDLDFNAEAPAVRVRGNLRDLSVDSWRGAPAARGINGYFETSTQSTGLGGLVELDSPADFAMHYPQVYEDFMPYGAVRGRIDWQWRRDSHQVRVNSGPISIDGDEGQGTAFLYLDLPTRKDLGEPEMTLMVALRDSDSRYLDRYLPRVLKPELKTWLDDSIGAARIPEAGFIWRGSLHADNHEGRTLQVYARVEDGNLDYQQGWPPLSALSATLWVDDVALDVWADGAVVGGARMSHGRAQLRAQAEGGSLLTIGAQARADADEGLAILIDSPVGGQLDDLRRWQLSGASDIDLDLAIPLGADRDRQRYDVTVALGDGRLALPGTAVDITAISGEVRYTLAEGLHSTGLDGFFFGQPLAAMVHTGVDGTVVELEGRMDVAGFAGYLDGLEGVFAGVAAMSGRLEVPTGDRDQPPVMLLESDLQGIAIDLPGPFGKAAAEPRPLSARLYFEGADMRIEGALGEQVAVVWQQRDGAFHRGAVELLGGQPQLPAGPGLRIAGSVPHFDWNEWRSLLAPFEAGADGDGGAVKLAPYLDLHFGELALGGFSLGAASIRGALQGDNRWRLQVDSERAAGEILTGGERTVLHLDHLRLPESAEDEEHTVAQQAGEQTSATTEEPGATEAGSGPLDGLMPDAVPALDFAAERISLGEQELGSLAFLSSSTTGGVRFDTIRGTLRGIAVEGGVLEWVLEGERHHSRFSAALMVEDFADTLEKWQLPRVIDSKEAAFQVELQWPARPWEIAAPLLDGYIGIDLDGGQFYRATGAPTNTFLRLVSLFNFDTWLRRLRFDFSDLFNQGVSFDHLRGGLAFSGGLVQFDEPIVATMPSGRIRLLGSADMVDEQLDARLVATLPVGTNLPWVAAVLGGLPAAAGVYLTGKLFKRQVDQLSSLSYRVTGSWDDPELAVDKIFSDKTDLETAVEAVPKTPRKESSP